MDNIKSLTKSKIVCTIGPASDSVETIKSLCDIGMDCARINFSHGTIEGKTELFHKLRECDPSLAILADIQGPKIRIGLVEGEGAQLLPGEKFIITSDDVPGSKEKVSISYNALPQEVKQGDLIYINDGIICVIVDHVEGNDIHCSVIAGGYISSRKGVNLPSTEISLSVPTEKDTADLKVIAELNPEFVAVSFVRDAHDVLKIKEMLAGYGNDTIRLVSKIERPQAVENFDSILEVSDGIMVARGDLGVELAPEDVLPVQKEMIHKCNVAGKPIIVATQMLESMIRAPVPTRAEVSDVYNAIEDGADAVMLSAETASGDYPSEAVSIMERIIRSSESLIPHRNPDDYDSEYETISEIIGHLVYAGCKEFRDMNYDKGKIVCFTHTGHTAHMISKYRPYLPILGVTANKKTAREMRLLWGVEPLLIEYMDDKSRVIDQIRMAVQKSFDDKLIEQDEKLIIAGNFFNMPAQSNTVSIFSADELMKLG